MIFFILNRDELELKAYERNYFYNYFDVNKNNNCFSLSYLFFFDNFELYRNFYKSFMRVYFLLAFFDFKKRMRRVNVYSLTLESYKNNLNNVLNAFSSLRNFNKNVILNLSQLIRVCIFSLCTIEDMF